VSSGEASTSPRSSRLTLGQMLIAVGVLAVGFAFLPWALSGVMAVTISGILVLQGLRLPLLTGRGGMWCWLPWALWCLALATCPVAIIVVGNVYQHTGPPAFTGPRPWAARVVDALGSAHLGLSVVASMSVVVLVREGFRWIAWAAIVAVGVFTAFAALGAAMSTTGVYL
jgi:hypothetical protein